MGHAVKFTNIGNRIVQSRHSQEQLPDIQSMAVHIHLVRQSLDACKYFVQKDIYHSARHLLISACFSYTLGGKGVYTVGEDC